MKFLKARNLAVVPLLMALCLIATACHPVKKISPASARQARLDWNLRTTVGAYQAIGSTDDKWNEPATNALAGFARLLSQIDRPEDCAPMIKTNCQAAIEAGCDDPLVTYLYIKFAMDQTNSREAYAKAFTKMVADMKASQYPPIRKFYAAARTMDQAYYTYGHTPAGKPIRIEMWAMVMDNLRATLADKTMSGADATDAAEVAFALIGGQKELDQLYQTIEKPLFDNWPDDAATWRFKGTAYIKMAWAARGGGYADAVSTNAWKTFFAYLDTADDALTNAWQLNSNDVRVPIQMIRLAEGKQKPREEMELWFNRAMTLDPNCYEACHYKLHYLYPQWYGSRDAMVAFGRECVAATNGWGGSVPLILADAHWEYRMYLDDGEEKSNYWMQPDVWPDINASYRHFFALNPDATDYYYNYAWYAYACGQWDLFVQLIPKLGAVNYSYFGGEEKFNQMVETAKANAAKTD